MRFAFLSCLFCVFTVSLPVYAVSEQVCGEGACFNQSVKVGEQTLPLRGRSLFEYWSFDVYTAAFYAKPEVNTIEKALSDTPKHLVLSYHRGLTKQNIVENSEYVLEKNPSIKLKSLRPKLDKWYEAFTDVKVGDTFAMQYQPGTGTRLIFNGKEVVLVEGDDFQRAYFGIWLSRYSVDSDFTAKLIGS